MEQNIDHKIAFQLKRLRSEQQFSLEQLSQKTGISRATLSRLENAEVSPTASVLGKLCAVYNITLSRLMAMVEVDFEPLMVAAEQDVWVDPETGYARRMISPPAEALSAEMIECYLPPSQKISYAAPPRHGLEHHIYMLEGALVLSLDEQTYSLKKGDCLRYQLFGASQFETSAKQAANYILTII